LGGQQNHGKNLEKRDNEKSHKDRKDGGKGKKIIKVGKIKGELQRTRGVREIRGPQMKSSLLYQFHERGELKGGIMMAKKTDGKRK